MSGEGLSEAVGDLEIPDDLDPNMSLRQAWCMGALAAADAARLAAVPGRGLAARVEALADLAHEAVSAVGGSHSHWREGGAGGTCRTCEAANERQDGLRARLRALLAADEEA